MTGPAVLGEPAIAGWQPFFAVAAGSAATLAGLLFVALAPHVREIAAHPLFRFRARSTFTILMVVLVVSGLALWPRQTGRALGLEACLLLALQLGALVAWFAQARKAAPRMPPGYLLRTGLGALVLAIALLAAVLLFVGLEVGLAVVAPFCLLSLLRMAFNSWALLFAIADAECGDGGTPRAQARGTRRPGDRAPSAGA